MPSSSYEFGIPAVGDGRKIRTEAFPECLRENYFLGQRSSSNLVSLFTATFRKCPVVDS
jgi:hypothetical protein